MNRMLSLLVALSLLVGASGCASFGGVEKIDPTQIALAYYDQDRTFEPVRIEGVQNITLQAAEGQTLTIILTTPLEPLSIYPRDPATLNTLLDGAAKLAAVIAAGLVGYEMVGALSTETTVVEPTVVTVPAR